ncbi:MAG: FG-GAP repeat protein [Flavobacteriales bacterium]|nr:FG-GAP repeat protein [Flavobacteriales bacterium]
MELHNDTLAVDHGAFQVEYINSPAGMRQNFIVRERPEGAGPVNVRLKVNSTLHPVEMDPTSTAFVDDAGTAQLYYQDLLVCDAEGDTLAAHMKVEDDLIVISVNDADAVYPIIVDPISTTAIWTTESNLASALLGTSVSSAGDVNGDGYSDILVGSPVWSNGQVGEGRVQLHYGGPNGPAAAIGWSYETNVVGANLGLGTSVTTAGDVNGDGFSDIIVGAPYLSNGQTNEGRVYVFHGSATGPSATPDWMTESDQASALFGYAVNCAGDVNGDGYSDVVVGAYRFSNGQTWEGRAFVYHGSATGLSAAANWTAESNQLDARFGFSVACAGDVNGDGSSDVIVGAPAFDNGQTNEGRAFVYHGSATGLAATAAWTTESNQASSQTGYSVSTAGDVNNDGYSDVVVGIPFYTSTLAADGRVAVHRGSLTGLVAAAFWTADSPVASAQFGQAVACAGDVNGDGFADVIVGAPTYANGQTGEGAAYAFLGSTTGLTQTWIREENQAGASCGAAVASAGDVNGDGFSDVIVGAPQWDNGQTNEGICRVFIGGANGAAPIQLPGGLSHPSSAAEHFGQRVAGAGDVNGDGYSDIIIGDRYFGAANTGAAFVYHGSAVGVFGSSAWTHVGSVPNGELGFTVASAGDVNGDGYSDVIVGAPYHSQIYTGCGMALVFHGSSTGVSAAPAWTTLGVGTDHHYGFTVASAGDVNGDGFADVLVGAPDEPAAGEGRVYLYFGSSTGLPTTPSATLSSATNGDFGECVATAGDVNGDGFSDVVIGAGAINRIHVYHGSISGISASPDLTYVQGGSASEFGSNIVSGPSAMTAGDVNGDGYSDIIVGARFYDNSLTDEGMAQCFLGGPSGLTTPSWTRYGGVAGGWFGIGVGSAGDVNGDGYSDVVIGGCQTNGGGRYSVYAGSPTGLSLVPLNTYTLGGSHGRIRALGLSCGRCER